MRKQFYILISTFLITILLMTSCKKYTCECTVHSTNSPESGGHSDFKVKGTKKKAKNKCENYSTEVDQYGNMTTCEIK